MKNKSQSSKQDKKGFIVVFVLFLTVAIGLAVGSLLNSATTELRINTRNIYLHEARNAAEALQEYATADIIKRFKDNPSLTGNDLINAGIDIPASATNLFSGTKVDLSNSEVLVGQLSAGSFEFIPNDGRNDPLAGKYAFSRSAVILSKAQVDASGSAGGGSITSHLYQEFELRDAPLFTHAIFYNMDLMVAPGPDMHVYGPVHSNRHLGATSANKLHFHDKVTAGGNFYVGHKMTDWEFHSGGYDADNVKFIDDAANMETVYKGSGDKSNIDNYWDSRQGDWEEEASQRWGGMLKDSAHGVPVLNPISIDDYEPDDPTTGADELLNHAYAMVEPLLPVGHSDRKTNTTRLEKFAMKAGLLLKVVEDVSKPSGYRVDAYKYNRPSAHSLLPTLDAFYDPTPVQVDLPAGLIGDANADMDSIEHDGEPESYEYGYTDPGYSGSEDVEGGWYDRRQRQKLDILSLDIGKLKNLIDDGHSWDDAGTGLPDFDPSYDWNGVVYVEFPTFTDSGGEADNIVLADVQPSAENNNESTTPGIALALIDGGTLPQTTFNSQQGLTIATNAALYVVGHYNSDNDATAAGSANETDALEVPAAIVADTVTLLSGNWSSNRAKSDENLVNSNPGNRPAADTEWAFGLISGYSPADPTTQGGDKNWGGGVQNLPRFLERWRKSGSTKAIATIRGSLVSLFESEVQTKPYNLSGSHSFGKWFRAPARNWGFSDLFRNNKMPPGTPSVRHPRLTNLRFIPADSSDPDDLGYTQIKTQIGY